MLLLLPARAGAQSGGATQQTTQAGVYTEVQARRGATVMEAMCSECHEAEEFTGAFLTSWSGTSVWALYDEVYALMPEDNPSSLEPSEYADVLAYIFQLNGLPTGSTELPYSKEALTSILIEWNE